MAASVGLAIFIIIMKPLYTEQEFSVAKSRQKLLLECLQCGQSFLKSKKEINDSGKRSKNPLKYCSHQCNGKSQRTRQIITCNQCSAQFIKRPCHIKFINNFCNRSCATYYRNAHKTKGYRVSKLELFLQQELVKKYSTLEFHFNRSDAINSELDIYIPSLKLAFELNGIFHYEAIFGQEKLSQIQNNDNRKFQACLEHNIELCIIDSSSLVNFSEKNALRFFDIVKSILDTKLIEMP